MVEPELNRFKDRVGKAVRASTNNSYRKAGTLFFSALIFLLFAFTTDIPWHLQTLNDGISYWDDAFLNSVASIYIAGGFSFLLTLVYSIVSGFALTNIAIQLKNSRISGKGLGSILPGFVATGCASCGVGLASFVGLTGVAAALPFHGDLFKIAGILLLFYALYDMGDPEICEV